MIEVRRQPSTGQGERRNRDRGPRGSLDRNGPDRNASRGAHPSAPTKCLVRVCPTLVSVHTVLKDFCGLCSGQNGVSKTC